METVPPSADSWAVAKASLRAADPRMASLVDADPTLDPDTVLDGWPTALWDALVFNVVGQQLSVAATRAILAQLEALHGGRLPTPVELLATDTETLRRIGLSRAELMRVKGVGRFTADRSFDGGRRAFASGESRRRSRRWFALRRPDIWSAADQALRRAVERVWELDAPASIAD